jgi:hypothetical protein
MPDDDDKAKQRLEQKRLRLQYAADNRKSEIALLWSRSLYFWGFITVVLASYGGAINSHHRSLALLSACFGFICALCWTLANRSSKYWQEVWKKKVEDAEQDVLDKPIFPRFMNPPIDEQWFFGPKQFSPSKLVMSISDMTVFVFAVLVIATRFPNLTQSCTTINSLVIICTVLYAIVILVSCRSGSPTKFWMRTWDRCRFWRERSTLDL